MSVSENISFNYPSLNRKDLMSLSTITSRDALTHKFKQINTNRDWSINLYNLDIKGSWPRKEGTLTNKIDFINKNDDIEKTSSKFLHYKLNKPEYNLSNKDIEKSMPRAAQFETVRCCNPLEPKYKLPKVEEMPFDEPKFIRDNIDISDIDGTKPKGSLKWKTRESFPLDNHDINGSKTKAKYIRNTKHNSIDYTDLTSNIFNTKRQVNPLDPVYEMKYKNGECYVHGMIPKSKPQTIYPYYHPDPCGLKTIDIDGANVGSLNKISKYSGDNLNLSTQDIDGCKPGSLKKGIQTTRCTNPMNPKYNYIGDHELIGDNSNPFGKTFREVQNPAFKHIQNEHHWFSQVEENLSGLRRTNFNFYQKRAGMNRESRTKNQNKSCIDIRTNDYEFEPKEKIQFDPDKYQKPSPNFAFCNDGTLFPSQNPEKASQIEIKKAHKTIDRLVSKQIINNTPFPQSVISSQKYFSKNNKKILNNSMSCNFFNKNKKMSNEEKLDKIIGQRII